MAESWTGKAYLITVSTKRIVGSKIEIAFTVKNTGTEKNSYTLVMKVVDNNNLQKFYEENTNAWGVEPGETKAVSFYWTPDKAGDFKCIGIVKNWNNTSTYDTKEYGWFEVKKPPADLSISDFNTDWKASSNSGSDQGYVKNLGGEKLDWETDISKSWITLSKETGSIDGGKKTSVTIYISENVRVSNREGYVKFWNKIDSQGDYKYVSIEQAGKPENKVDIENAWWSNKSDVDGDGYFSSARLNWKLRVENEGDQPNVKSVVEYRKNNGSWKLWNSDVVNVARSIVRYFTIEGPGMTHGLYDWRVMVYRDGKSSKDDEYNYSNDSDLNDVKIETASEDEPTAIIEDTWWVEEESIDEDEDGFISSGRLKWKAVTKNHANNPNQKLTVKAKVFFQKDGTGSWTIWHESEEYEITGSQDGNVRYCEVGEEGKFPNEKYDWKIEIYRGNVKDDTRDNNDDNDLDNVKIENPSEDVFNSNLEITNIEKNISINALGNISNKTFSNGQITNIGTTPLSWDVEIAGSEWIEVNNYEKTILSGNSEDLQIVIKPNNTKANRNGEIRFYNIQNEADEFIITIGQEGRRIPEGFVYIDDNSKSLYLNNAPFRFVGNNLYWLQDEYKRGNKNIIDEILEQCADNNLNVIRTWGFNDDPNSISKMQWKYGNTFSYSFFAFDSVIIKAKSKNFKLIVTLVNYWDDYGGIRQYADWVGKETSPKEIFYTDEDIKKIYRDYVFEIVTRYKDESTIMAWELINEPNNGGNDPTGNIIRSWIYEMSEYIKALDLNHLVSVGEEGYDSLKEESHWVYNGSKGISFTKNIQVPYIDYANIHLYPDKWFNSDFEQEGLNWMQKHMDIANKYGKPLVVGEFGYAKEEKAEIFESWLKYINDNKDHINGSNVWQFVNESRDNALIDSEMHSFSLPDDNDIVQVLFQQANILPVELIKFFATIVRNKVQINWQTATEVNNYGFEIERSSFQKDGTTPVRTDWKMIGFVEGHGNSNSPKDYSFIDADNLSGLVKYRLKQIDTDGSFEYSNIIEVEINSPKEFKLSQNYPNPFNPSTIIRYDIPNGDAMFVTLKVYNSLGEEIEALVNERQTSGSYEVEFNAKNLSTGIYFYRLTAGASTLRHFDKLNATQAQSNASSVTFSETKKLILIK
ncbi:MAG: cellulase family glycosylhydrolase [Melioribacteraceae bacterium]|nr:cellulase family glycosylhydrolase [Melioribacteraceae bacterium]